jgi:hypothetical protein
MCSRYGFEGGNPDSLAHQRREAPTRSTPKHGCETQLKHAIWDKAMASTFGAMAEQISKSSQPKPGQALRRVAVTPPLPSSRVRGHTSSIERRSR